MRLIRTAIALATMAGADGFMLWVVLTGPSPSQPLTTAIILVFLVEPFGAIWMFYDAARKRKKAWPYVMCAVIPYFFVWHYFQHVLGRRSTGEQAMSRGKRTRQSDEIPPTDDPPRSSRRSPALTWVRRALWALALLSGTAVALTAVVGPWWPYTKVQLALVLMFFAVHPFGSLWMLYHTFRYEARPLPFVFLAFIPYAFLWYYFEKVRVEPRLAENRSQ